MIQLYHNFFDSMIKITLLYKTIMSIPTFSFPVGDIQRVFDIFRQYVSYEQIVYAGQIERRLALGRGDDIMMKSDIEEISTNGEMHMHKILDAIFRIAIPQFDYDNGADTYTLTAIQQTILDNYVRGLIEEYKANTVPTV